MCGPLTSRIFPWSGDSSSWVATMDWRSRYVVARRITNTLEIDFCVDALDDALLRGVPEVFNTDRRSQFTSQEFTQILNDRGVKISMNGKG